MHYTRIMKEIAHAFDGVIGQSEIVKNRIVEHTAYAMGSNDNISVLYGGEAGLGKSRLLLAEKAARAASVKIRHNRAAWVDSVRSPQEIRIASVPFKNFLKTCAEGDGMIVDEFHEIALQSTVQLKMVQKMIKDLLDCNQGHTRRSVLSENLIITRDAQDIFFAVGTNFVSKIPDGAAIVSRFGGATVLSLYTEDQLAEIALSVAKEKGVRIHPDTISLIAKCGRGTARPMKHIIKYLKQLSIVEGKETVNRAEVLEAMRAKGFFPFGLTRREVNFLLKSQNGGVRVREFPALFGVEVKETNDSLAFLGVHGFITLRMGVCEITPKGLDFLSQLKKEKFLID